MENYQEKARENFYRNRPYGIHIDYARKGFVLFNHYTNSLGKQETGSIEGLPLEKLTSDPILYFAGGRSSTFE